MFVVHASRPENTSGGHDARRLGPASMPGKERERERARLRLSRPPSPVEREREIKGYASGPGFFREPITFASKQASKQARERETERGRERERAREKASKK